MTSAQVHSTRLSAWFLLPVLTLALLASRPASATIVLAPFGGDIAFVGTQSNAGPEQDVQSQSAPSLMWGTTLTSAAHDNLSGADASAAMTLGISFSNTQIGAQSVGQGTTDKGGTNKGGVFVFVQFEVQQTQQYHAETTLIPGSWGSSHALVFMSNLLSDQLVAVALIGGPGTVAFDGRLSPGIYIYYYTNAYDTEGMSGNSHTVLSGVTFTDVPNPLIQQQPQSQTVNQGSSASFTVGAGGPFGPSGTQPEAATATLTYQWRHNYQNLVDGGRITGATTNHLVIANTALPDSGIYDCVVTQDAIVEPSSAAFLTVRSGSGAVDPSDATFGLSLATPAPSPFTSRTLVRFTLPRESDVALDVLDVGGRRVKVLASGDRLSPGAHEIEWDGATDRGDRAPEGIYFVRLRTGSVQLARRVVRIAH